MSEGYDINDFLDLRQDSPIYFRVRDSLGVSDSDDMITVSLKCRETANEEGFLLKNVRKGAFTELQRR